MKQITWICSATLGLLLTSMGYGIQTWQFWAAVGLYLVPVGYLLYEVSKIDE